MIGYYFDENSSIATPIRNIQTKTIKGVWEVHHRKFIVSRVVLDTWIMYNDASLELKTALKNVNVIIART